MSVTASPKVFSVATGQSTFELPARIREGEKLFAMGSYDAAVAMLAAGLEEYLQAYVPARRNISTLGQLGRFLEQTSFGPEFQRQLANVVNIRRKAVHGTDRQSVQKTEAAAVRRAVRAIIKSVPARIDASASQ